MSFIKECQLCYCSEDDINLYGRKNVSKTLCVHNNCCLFSCGLCQNGNEDDELQGFLISDINNEILRAKKLKCNFCKKIGATIGCVISSCSTKFHFNCGLQKGIFYEYFGQYKSYCTKHKPKQNSDLFIMFDPKTSICAICLSNFDKIDSIIASSCCKDCFFHKSCIQNYAFSSGVHYFKCPKCNNSESFKLEMLSCGICIPDRDAQWEQEVSYFRNQENLRFICDVIECKSSQSRNDNLLDTEWEIMRCDDCGYNGTHLFCSGLKTPMDPWICHECSPSNALQTPLSSNQNSSETEHILDNSIISPKSNNYNRFQFFNTSPRRPRSGADAEKKQVDIRSYFSTTQTNTSSTTIATTPLTSTMTTNILLTTKKVIFSSINVSLSEQRKNKTKKTTSHCNPSYSNIKHQRQLTTSPLNNKIQYSSQHELPHLKSVLKNIGKKSLKKGQKGKISKISKHKNDFNTRDVLMRFAMLTGDVKLLPSTKIYCVIIKV